MCDESVGVQMQNCHAAQINLTQRDPRRIKNRPSCIPYLASCILLLRLLLQLKRARHVEAQANISRKKVTIRFGDVCAFSEPP